MRGVMDVSRFIRTYYLFSASFINYPFSTNITVDFASSYLKDHPDTISVQFYDLADKECICMEHTHTVYQHYHPMN